MPIRPVKLAVVDDHILFRKTLSNYLSDQDNMDVIIQSGGISELFPKLKGSRVDVLLLDVFMPNCNGCDAIEMIRREFPAVKILILSMSSDMDMISDLLEAGIHGYISKSDEPENLLQAIIAASEGRIYRNRLFTEALYWNKQNTIKTFSPVNPSLSDREKKILQLLWEEKSNKEIADELFLGIRSIEKIRQDIKEKIGAKSTVGLIKYAIQEKIIRWNNQLASRPSAES
jgi:DNA-binding NarL/FixJ family response regulator